MKLLLLFLVSNISISLISATGLQYDQKYLSLDSLSQLRSPQLDNTNNVDSFELISIDNLLTKHDPSLTPRDLLRLRHQRGLLRAEALSSSSSARVSQRLFYGDGPYFMSMGVGTPPQNVSMVLATGSDISWLQSLPCKKCYNQSDLIFDPSKSRTFSPVACGDSRCKQQLQYYFDTCDNNTCLYIDYYTQGLFSQGTFSTETLTLESGISLENIALGFGHDNQGWFTESSGYLGLGRGDLSFITQTAGQFQSRQFSYCLAFWFSNTSKSSIVFGPSAVPTRKDVYTPLIYTNTTTTYYYVNLTGISVDGTPVLGIHPSVFDLKPNGLDGGVNIDSGTTYTQLIKEAYVPLRKAFRAAIKKQTNSTVSVGSPLNYLWFDTCYNISSGMLSDVEVPIVELHFDKGANMTLRADNTMILMDRDDTVATVCFAFISNDRYTTIGNIQQQSFRIVHDLPDSRIGFVPDSC